MLKVNDKFLEAFNTIKWIRKQTNKQTKNRKHEEIDYL